MKETTFTEELRREIAEAHTQAHGGVFKVEEFVDSARDPNHPAHDWFTWDDSAAAEAYRRSQARDFIRFEIQSSVVKPAGKLKIVINEIPEYLSPMDTRQSGGGYVQATPEEFRRQALNDGFGLIAWLRRYGSAMSESEVRKAQSLINSLKQPLKQDAKQPSIVTVG